MPDGTSDSENIAGVVPASRRLPAGSLLFGQGNRSFGIFRLLSGGVLLVRSTSDGFEVPMHKVRPGELFAEASLFSPHYHCDARVVRDSEVLVYPRTELCRRLQANPDALWAFTGNLARRVQGLRTHMALQQTRPVTARVLQFLHLNCDADGCWRAESTLKEVADELGMTHEALYRAIASLVREGHISRISGAIRLTGPGKTLSP